MNFKKKKANREKQKPSCGVFFSLLEKQAKYRRIRKSSWKRAPTDNANEDLVNVLLFYSNDLKIFFLEVKKENQNLSKES